MVIRSGAPMQPGAQPSLPSPEVATVVPSAAPVAAEVREEQSSSRNFNDATVAEAPRPVAEQIPGLIPRLGDVLENRADFSELTPSAHSIAVELTAAGAMEPNLSEAVGRSLGFEDRAMPAARLRHTAEALPTAAAATEPRRARLLAALGSTFAYSPEPSAPEHAKRSIIRHLAEDGWDRSMSRLEAGADRLSIRF